MWVGCRVTVAEHLGSSELAAQLRTVRPTGLAGVPSLWHEVSRGLVGGVLSPADAGSLRYVTNSGGRLQIEDVRTLRRLLPQVRVFSMYGLTEAFRSAWLDPAELDRRPDSFGKALPGVELLLVDPDSGRVLSDGDRRTGARSCPGGAGLLAAAGGDGRAIPADPRGVAGTGGVLRRSRAPRCRGLSLLRSAPRPPAQVAGHSAVAGRSGAGAAGIRRHRRGRGVRPGRRRAGPPHRPVRHRDTGDLELPARIHRQCRSRLPHLHGAAGSARPAGLPHNANGKVDFMELQRRLGGCTGDR